MAASRELLLKPLHVPDGMAGTDAAEKLFNDFKRLYGIFTACLKEEAKLSEMRVNENRRARRLSPGDVVFWQLPYRARTDKNFFPEPSNGPYIVARQPTKYSVILKTPRTGKEINEGRLIPLDQIIDGSVATQLAFNGEA